MQAQKVHEIPPKHGLPRHALMHVATMDVDSICAAVRVPASGACRMR